MTSTHDRGSDSHISPSLPTPSSKPQPRTEFTAGGDLVLKSIDGVEFNAHSIILSLASPVFADMFDIGSHTSGQAVELAETGEIIELMLKFIYPVQSPDINSFDTLNKALHIAKKYELSDMRHQLRQKLSLHGSPISILADPLNALGVVSAHGLKAEAQLATSLAHSNYDFTSVDGLLQLAKSLPEAIPWIIVIGIPSAKSKIIFEVLFSYHMPPMRISNDLCGICANSYVHSWASFSPPEWMARWTHALSIELTKRPVRDWGPYFKLPFLYETIGRFGGMPIRVAQGTCTCLDNLSQTPADYEYWPSDLNQNQFPDRFSAWAHSVYVHLTKRLTRLEELEELME